jgi:hypothetical protein
MATVTISITDAGPSGDNPSSIEWKFEHNIIPGNPRYWASAIQKAVRASAERAAASVEHLVDLRG